MRCAQISPYLPGFSGGELGGETSTVVARHVAGCVDCRSSVARLDRVRTGLATLAVAEFEPPISLVDDIMEQVRAAEAGTITARASRMAQIASEHKVTIASAAGTAVVAVGAGYALWRAVRGRRVSAAAPA